MLSRLGVPCLVSALTATAFAVQPAIAQVIDDRAATPADGTRNPVPLGDDEIVFSAGSLDYDQDRDIVTASGDVRMVRAGNRLRADRVIWNRATGEVRAEGDVALVTPGNDRVFADSVMLTDTLRDGMIENLLLVLDDGSRLAAERASRDGNITRLDRAPYTACRVVDDETGCPRTPAWKITAVRVVYDENRRRVFYDGARIELFGLPLVPLPGLSHPTGAEAGSGFLVPDLRFSRANGLEFALPYYWRLDRNRDFTLTPRVYTDVLPALEAKYRALTPQGAYQLGGIATFSRVIPVQEVGIEDTGDREFRGYFEGNGRFQLDPNWSISGSGRIASDRTFLRRYDISRDDRLRSVVKTERIDTDSYFSVAGWAVQTLRVGQPQGEVPIALPVVDARQRLDGPLVGGKIDLRLNSLAIVRSSGQDTRRAFASAQWDVRRLTSGGQELIFTAFARGDVYNADETSLTETVSYRGEEGWTGRAIAAAAAEIRWPLVGGFLGGTQRITPRLQFVATPPIDNIDIPNEDARAIELEDSNLFALNRFPGYDRFEDGARVTAGLDYALDRPGLAIRANIGQSFRLTSKPGLFPDGTGLSNSVSDIVGRTSVRIGRRFSLDHRYRLDKDNLAIRRNEIDATIGGRSTYATLGYLRLNRDIGTEFEDLQDREEIRAGGRIQFSRYWSVFGSAIIDLTGAQEDPFTSADGYEPVRHRLGFAYEDDCVELGLTWRRDYATNGDARRGNTFLLRLAFRQLGR